jgi:chaperonin GroES
MSLIPLHDRVVVQRVESEKVSEGGIVFVASGVEKPNQGVVLAVGPGKQVGDTFIKTVVKVGQTVIFGKTAGTTIKVDDEEIFMIVEDEIYGILEK